ncbi:hypothetical protein [Nocardiopsis coralliicola]
MVTALARALAGLLAALLLIVGAPPAWSSAPSGALGGRFVVLPVDGTEVAAPSAVEAGGPAADAGAGPGAHEHAGPADERSLAAVPPSAGDHRALRDLPDAVLADGPVLPSAAGARLPALSGGSAAAAPSGPVSGLPEGRAPPDAGSPPAHSPASPGRAAA